MIRLVSNARWSLMFFCSLSVSLPYRRRLDSRIRADSIRYLSLFIISVLWICQETRADCQRTTQSINMLSYSLEIIMNMSTTVATAAIAATTPIVSSAWKWNRHLSDALILFRFTQVSSDEQQKLQGSIFNESVSSSATARYLLIIQCLSIYALILVLVGTVGNLLTIITLLRRNLRRLVTIRYLIIVSICDTVSLYGWNLNNFYKFNLSLTNDNLEELSLTHCRLLSYMTFVSLQLSSWCLTAVSLGKRVWSTSNLFRSRGEKLRCQWFIRTRLYLSWIK